MTYIKYRLVLEKYLISDKNKVVHKYPSIESNTFVFDDSHTDYKHEKALREDMYRKMEDMCISLEEEINDE